MSSPFPPTSAPQILDRVAELLKERHDEVAQTISAEAGKPMKAARVEAERAVSTYTMAAVEARRSRARSSRWTPPPRGSARSPTRCACRSGSSAPSPLQLPAQPRRAQGRARARRRLCRRAEARRANAALRAPAGRARDRGRAPSRLAQRPRRALRRDRRRHRRGRAREADHIHRLLGRRLEDPRARTGKKRVNLELGNATPVVVEADADIEEAATKLAANAFSFAGQSCISVQRIYVKREAYDDFVSRFVPKVQALKVGDPGEEDTDVGPGHRRGRARPHRLLGRGGEVRRSNGAHGRRGRRRPAPANGARRRHARHEGLAARRSSGRSAPSRPTTPPRRRSSSPTRPSTGSRQGSSRPT